ncbi:MAG: hypothetical protein GEV08_23480, partial [Acidimicrobiia bacterium]|nr:hypothetical protein [Acidimicrobiia bacterium]
MAFAALVVVVLAPAHLSFETEFQTGLQALIGGIAILVAVLRAAHLRRDRAVWALFAVALLVGVTSDLGAELARSTGRTLSAPLVALSLVSYPLLFLTVLLLLRARLGSLGSGVAIDGLIAGLGLAGLAAVALDGPLGQGLVAGRAGDGPAFLDVVGASSILLLVAVAWGVAG